VKHGVNAFKSGRCRCAKCKKGNNDYERLARDKARRALPVLTGLKDSYTREELLAFREQMDD